MQSPIDRIHKALWLPPKEGYRWIVILGPVGEIVPFPSALLYSKRECSESHRWTIATTGALVEDWIVATSAFSDIMGGINADDADIDLLGEHLRRVSPTTAVQAAKMAAEDPEFLARSLVCNATFRTRLDQAAKYIIKRCERYSVGMARDVKQSARVAAATTAMAILDLRPRAEDAPRQGLPIEVERRLHQISHPESPANPLPKVQRATLKTVNLIRSHAGTRANEPLLLQLRDVSPRGTPPIIIFVDRRDNPEDPRFRRPTLKSGGQRKIEIDPRVHAAIHDYIEGPREELLATAISSGDPERRRFALANKYVFVSTSGRPLSIPALQKMMRQMRVAEGLDGAMTGAQIRNSFNDRNLALFGLTHIEDSAAVQGRRPDSAQNVRYPNVEMRRRGADMMRQMHDELFADGTEAA